MTFQCRFRAIECFFPEHKKLDSYISQSSSALFHFSGGVAITALSDPVISPSSTVSLPFPLFSKELFFLLNL